MLTKKLLLIIAIGMLGTTMLVAMESSTHSSPTKSGIYMPADAQKINDTEFVFGCSVLGTHEFPILFLKTLMENDEACVISGSQDRMSIWNWKAKKEDRYFSVSDKKNQRLGALAATQLSDDHIRFGFTFYEVDYMNQLQYQDDNTGAGIDGSWKNVILQVFLDTTDFVALAYKDGSIGTVNFSATGQPLKILGKHEQEVTCLLNLGVVGLCGSSHALASGSKDGTVKLWDTQKGILSQTIEVGHEIISLARLDFETLAITFKNHNDGTLGGKIWDMELNCWKYYFDHKPDGYYNFTSYGTLALFHSAAMLLNTPDCSSFGVYDMGEGLTHWHTAEGKQINLYASTDSTNNPNKNIKVTHMTMINDHLVFVSGEAEANSEYKIYYSNEPFVFIKHDNP